MVKHLGLDQEVQNLNLQDYEDDFVNIQNLQSPGWWSLYRCSKKIISCSIEIFDLLVKTSFLINTRLAKPININFALLSVAANHRALQWIIVAESSWEIAVEVD